MLISNSVLKLIIGCFFEKTMVKRITPKVKRTTGGFMKHWSPQFPDRV